VDVGSGIYGEVAHGRALFFVAPALQGVHQGDGSRVPVEDAGFGSHGGDVQGNRFRFEQFAKGGEIFVQQGAAHEGERGLHFGKAGLVEGAGVGEGMPGTGADFFFFGRKDDDDVNQFPVVRGGDLHGVRRFVALAGEPFDKAASDGAAGGA
jgi:hypothetical protein